MADEVLETGWLPTTPTGDNLLHDMVANSVARVQLVAESVGGDVTIDDGAVIARAGEPDVFSNPVVLRRPLTEVAVPAFVERLERCLGTAPGVVMSPWPTPDLAPHGLHLYGHPPLMVRFPGPSAARPVDGLRIEEARDGANLAEIERTLIDGFPLDLPEAAAGTVVGVGLLGGPFRQFIGRVDGRPVATAAAMVSNGVVAVEHVATLPNARNRGYGEAVTWAATLTEPDLPAVLLASDPGRPIYERMGFVALHRWTLWGWRAVGQHH
jgi:hypothetical protein